MKHSFYILLTLFSFSAFAQTKCKYEKYEVDKYENNLQIITKSKAVVNTFDEDLRLSIQFTRTFNGDTTLYTLRATFVYEEAANIEFEIEKDKHRLYFSLANMSVVELLPSQSTKPVIKDSFSEYKANEGYKRMIAEIDYPITAEQLEQLQSADFVEARIYYKELPTNKKAYKEFDRPDRFIKKDFLKELIFCLLK